MTRLSKILLAIFAVVLLVYIFKGRSEPVKNAGSLVIDNPVPSQQIVDGVVTGVSAPAEETVEDYIDQSRDITNASMTPENSRYRPVDEAKGVYANYTTMDGGVSPYSGLARDVTEEKKRNLLAKDGSFDVDMYNVNNLLPQERHDDWFEVIEEPISVKNRHLMSLQRPIGINSIGESLRNATHDLRPAPVNPKFVTGPWMQSTIEPDYNTKSLC